jgi:enamine deaminase RidA (YjgF/YER057c/UK114 family)
MSVGHSRECKPKKTRPLPPAEATLSSPEPSNLVIPGSLARGAMTASFSCLELAGTRHVELVVTPSVRGSFREEALEALSALTVILTQAGQHLTVISQTVFLREPARQKECEKLLSAHYGAEAPVTNFVAQAPCSGAALAIEASAVAGESVKIERFGDRVLSVRYPGIRWIHCSGIRSNHGVAGTYGKTTHALEEMREALLLAGCSFERVVRTWFYVGGITAPEGQTERYKEFNRARAGFYQNLRFCCSVPLPIIPQGIYPASTGIGMEGSEISVGCLALETESADTLVLPLENPQQTPAYAYHPKYSPESPKFSRAKSLVQGGHITTWISGTASVVRSESRHLGDIEKQTQQTLDNIEQLLAPENFAFHGIRGGGATLRDLAKVRVYVKRVEDFAACRAICEQRLGNVPSIYVVADICRPELLVEIEGLAFSRYAPPQKT